MKPQSIPAPVMVLRCISHTDYQELDQCFIVYRLWNKLTTNCSGVSVGKDRLESLEIFSTFELWASYSGCRTFEL